MRTPQVQTAPDWLARLRHVTAHQAVSMGMEPEPWLRALCIDLLRNQHGSSPEFEEAAASFQPPAPAWSGGGLFLAVASAQAAGV